MQLAYMDLARECLSTAFILTQRNAAIQRLAACDNASLKDQILADHVIGRRMATVGISHLSTSRQHWSRPSVTVEETFDGYELSGEAPWVTGASRADLFVTGGSLSDGRQILVAIPAERSGVEICSPLKMLSLNETETGTVRLHRVAVVAEEVIAGPIELVMKNAPSGSGSGTGAITTSSIAIGAAEQNISRLHEEAAKRPQLDHVIAAFSAEHAQLRRDLLSVSASNEHGEQGGRNSPEELRLRANSLVSRTAHALMAVAKGAGFVSGHSAERAIRDSMFFQVWSCPSSVTMATLDELIR